MEPVELDAADASWAPVAAAALGVPRVRLSAERTLGELAQATAGFRDEHYGILPFVVDRLRGDDRSFPPLVTSGLIEPGRLVWGERPARLGGVSRAAPRLDLAALHRAGDGRVARWIEARRVPKVVMATQTKVVEAAVDAEGRCVPCTPVITVEPPADRLGHVAAVLLAPPVTAWALYRAGGTALAAGAVKLAARQVREIPLPTAAGPWDEAAEMAWRLPSVTDPEDHRRLLRTLGERMCAAYRTGGDSRELLRWWESRLG
jgi:hypothetical protein